MLNVTRLTRAYGPVTIVDDVTFSVEPGTMLALLGPNGAGKSTTMRVLSGTLPPTSGTFTVNGAAGQSEQARRSTGYVPDTRGLFPRLTAAEHIELAARLARSTGWQTRASALVEQLSLSPILNAPSSTFSHGQSRRVSVAMAIVTRPALLLVDEPFDGVDPVGVDIITRLLDEERKRGAAIVLTTHLLDAAETADHVAIFRTGSLIGPVPTSELLAAHGTLKAAWGASQQ